MRKQTVGVARFAAALDRARKVQAAIDELMQFDPSTFHRLNSIYRQLSRQIGVAQTRLDKIKKAFSEIADPYDDGVEIHTLLDNIQERMDNLEVFLLKIGDTEHEATLAFASFAMCSVRDRAAITS